MVSSGPDTYRSQDAASRITSRLSSAIPVWLPASHPACVRVACMQSAIDSLLCCKRSTQRVENKPPFVRYPTDYSLPQYMT